MAKHIPVYHVIDDTSVGVVVQFASTLPIAVAQIPPKRKLRNEAQRHNDSK